MGSDADVLVVDDEVRLADLFGAWLESDWSVEIVYGGEEALETVDDSIEVVLLDRRMPGLSGDEVLTEIRDRGYDCRVVMITAVDPDFDVLEMEFDDYLVKPVSREELTDVVESVQVRAEYETEVQELFSLASKRALLEAEKPRRELENSEEYRELVERVETLTERVDETISDLEEHGEFPGAFQDIPDETEESGTHD